MKTYGIRGHGERVYMEERGNCGNEVGQNGCGGGGGGGWITFLPALRRYLPVSKVPFIQWFSIIQPPTPHPQQAGAVAGRGGRRKRRGRENTEAKVRRVCSCDPSER